eukprot:GHUV01048226.1.p2 GENE.GHUV01048226.1~~GHUV01048226.1.p2  ORF type:complete len:112 (+),score=15.35 GHUV01048226.1:342-677(+)
MKVKIVQHVWHSKEAVFSVDFHPAGYMVTGGLDKTINVLPQPSCPPVHRHHGLMSACIGLLLLQWSQIWDVAADEDGSHVVTHLTDLQGHTKGVNCVRFSHSGDLWADLAT